MRIPEYRVDQALNEIGKDKAEVSITKAEFFDCRFFFLTEFFDKKITIDLFKNEMRARFGL